MIELYHGDKYLKEAESDIKSLFKRDDHCCVILNNNIFYPQGGGQKGDQGILIIAGKEFHVVNTIKDHDSYDAVLNVEPEIPEELKKEKVKCILDWDFRYKQMRLHTCVHLHHCILEEVAKKEIPHPGTSSIENGFAYNRYENSDFDPGKLEEANIKFQEIIKTDTPVITYPIPEKEGFRYWECREHKIPCGGIHVNKLNEIGCVNISTSAKKGKITIKFTL